MFSVKNIGFVVVILILLGGNIWLYTRTVSLDGEVEALLDALSRPSDSEMDFEGEISALTQQLREEQGERTRQTGRAASLEHTNKTQKREIAELQIQLKSLEVEVRRYKQSSDATTASTSMTETAEIAEAVEVEVMEAVETVASVDTTQTTTESGTTDTDDADAGAEPQGDVHDVQYVIKQGDLLQDLALTYYGDSTQWKRILDANRDVVSDARSLQVGMKLTIPDVPR
jgi:nucleoid-associated protein YgaU